MIGAQSVYYVCFLLYAQKRRPNKPENSIPDFPHYE